MNTGGELKENGMRVTSQRARIIEIIRNGQGHLDADEIYRQAREQEPRLSLSTVYRTLQALKNWDWWKKFISMRTTTTVQ